MGSAVGANQLLQNAPRFLLAGGVKKFIQRGAPHSASEWNACGGLPMSRDKEKGDLQDVDCCLSL